MTERRADGGTTTTGGGTSGGTTGSGTTGSSTPETLPEPHAAQVRIAEELHPGAPGLPAHRPRLTDLDPGAAKRAERQVAALFALSALGTIAFVAGYVAVPLGMPGRDPVAAAALSTKLLGGGLFLALFCLGAGAVHWARKLMPSQEIAEERHPVRSGEEDRTGVLALLRESAAGTGFTRRKLIRRALAPALALLALPALVLFRDLGPLPRRRMRGTLWRQGVRIVTEVTHDPLRPADIPVGGLVSAVPANLEDLEDETQRLTELGKAALLLVRMRPEEIVSQQGDNWDYSGILAYSKICTHVGCPLGLYEQTTHHMLCPCHQSTFDMADSGKVLFGPAARNLPQLAITVDADGYLIAAEGFRDPVGPSFWERG